MDVKLRDDRERAVVELWRQGDLSWSTIQVYLHWIRRFRSYCDQRKVIEADQLSLEGAVRFARKYAGRRLNGRRSARSCRDTARSALHAWACALRSLGVSVPTWRNAPEARALPPLLNEYCEYRRAHNGLPKARWSGTLSRFSSSFSISNAGIARLIASL